jgi:hypothetical protein
LTRRSASAILQIIERLGIGFRCIGMIDPLHDGPWPMRGPLGAWAFQLLIQRLDGNAVRRAANQLVCTFALENGGHAGLPHLPRWLRKITHGRNASAQFRPVNWPLD